MTLEEWTFQADRIQHLWRTPEWSNDTIRAQYDILSALPAAVVRDSITALAEEGAPRPPSPGQIRKQALDIAPGAIPPKPRHTCICHEGVGAYKECKSGHPDGWIDRRELEVRAYEVMQGCKKQGMEVRPWEYPELQETLTGMLTRQLYDQNIAAGRPLNQQGGEEIDLRAAGL